MGHYNTRSYFTTVSYQQLTESHIIQYVILFCSADTHIDTSKRTHRTARMIPEYQATPLTEKRTQGDQAKQLRLLDSHR